MVKKAEEKKDAQVAQADDNTKATQEAAAPAAGENGNAPAAGQEDVKDTAKADAAADTTEGSPTASATGSEAKVPTGEPDEARLQPPLETLSVLADRHRVTSWQQAALMRCMGWESGKLVTDAEYHAALERIKNRPMGGGRLA